jgi:RNA polymerase sigma factor (sigma-70 family)
MTTDDDVALLVKRAADGDQLAWDSLVERYTNLMWSVARGYRLERSDAADVVQVAWLRLVEHLGGLRDPERVGSWLATTVRRECLQLLATRKRRGTVLDDQILDGVPDPAAPVDTGLLTKERDVALWQAFAGLPERCQKLLRVLMVDPPPSYVDVSASLEMPIGSIGPTRARCLDRLRGLLGEPVHDSGATS